MDWLRRLRSKLVHRSASDSAVCVWQARATLGETPVWEPASARVWFIDGAEGAVMSCTADGGSASRTALAPPLGFLKPRTKRGFWLGCGLEVKALDENGVLGATLCRLPGDPAQCRLNDAGIDTAGRLWTGTMHIDGCAPIGALYRVDPDGRVSEFTRDFTIPNGFAVSPCGGSLYVADSPRREIYRFSLSTDGRLGDRTLFARFDEADGYPDGMAMDSAAHLWVAHYGGGRVSRFRPDGTCERSIAMPVSQVTALTFGGADGKSLFITSAAQHLSNDARKREPLAGALFTITAPVKGAAAFGFDTAEA